IRLLALRLGLAEADRAARAPEVPDRLAALAFHLADAVPAERAEEVPIEGQAALDRGDDEIDVVNASGAQRVSRHRFRAAASLPAQSGAGDTEWFCSTTTS